MYKYFGQFNFVTLFVGINMYVLCYITLSIVSLFANLSFFIFSNVEYIFVFNVLYQFILMNINF
jgi:hypothetical protein